MTNQVLKAFLISVIFILFFLLVINNRNAYLTKFDPVFSTNLYNHSQFAPNPQDRQKIIQDEDLYAYAGWYYLTTGKIDSINIEHPPLGKYLIGLSILLFGNQNIIQILYTLTLLLLSFLLAKKLLKKTFLSLLIPLFLLNEKLFQQQLQKSFLDFPHAVFIILFIYLTTLKQSKKTCLLILLLGFALGAVSSIKYPVTAIILGSTYFFIELLTKNFVRIKNAFLVILIGIFIYLFSYAPLFIHNGVTGFVDVQIKALKIHLSHLPHYPKLVPLRVMFLNQWPVWWDQDKPIHQVAEWNFVWPFLALSILLNPFFYFFLLKKTKKRSLLLLFLFSWLYFIFINSRLFFPAYLLILFPFSYLLLLWELKLFILWYKKRII